MRVDREEGANFRSCLKPGEFEAFNPVAMLGPDGQSPSPINVGSVAQKLEQEPKAQRYRPL